MDHDLLHWKAENLNGKVQETKLPALQFNNKAVEKQVT